MFKKSLTVFLLSFLILIWIFAFSVKVVTATIEPSILLTVDGEPVGSSIPRITNRTPTIVGSCNLPFAKMDYEINNLSILGSGKADRRGVWEWTVPQELDYGLQTLYVTATDPNDSANTKTNVFKIEVTSVGTIVKLGAPWFLAVVVLYMGAFIVSKRLNIRLGND